MEVSAALLKYATESRRAAELLESIPKHFVSSEVMRAWELGGLLSPAYDTHGILVRTWINVVAHNCAVGRFAYRLARHMEKHLAAEGCTLVHVAQAALVHDAWKRLEDVHVRGEVSRGRDILDAQDSTEEPTLSFLRGIGFSEEVVQIAISTGNKVFDLSRKQEFQLAKKIVGYADCCTSGDTVTSYSKRFDDLMPHFEPGGRYAGLNEAFRARYGVTHRERYDQAVLPIQRELANLAGFTGAPTDLYLIS